MKFKNNKYAQYIIDNFADNEIENISVKQYLNLCADSINDNSFENFTTQELNKTLEEILGKKFLKEFLEDRLLYPIFYYTESVHDFVLETIKIELIKLNALNNKFYEYYTAKLNISYQDYYTYGVTKNINDSGINKAYQILQQILEFKNVIDFDN